MANQLGRVVMPGGHPTGSCFSDVSRVIMSQVYLPHRFFDPCPVKSNGGPALEQNRRQRQFDNANVVNLLMNMQKVVNKCPGCQLASACMN
jgi:hypothetical protein